MHFFNFGFELLYLVDAAFFTLPAGLHGVKFVLQVCQLFPQLLQPLPAELVILFLEGHFLDFELHDLPADIVQLCGHGVNLCADKGAGFVHKVNCLVWEEAVGNIAV